MPTTVETCITRVMKPFKVVAKDGDDLDLSVLPYPLMGTPKIDGMRCVKLNGVALTSALKQIPNRYIRQRIHDECLDGWDGEITVGENIQDTVSAVMSIGGEPQVTWQLFDQVLAPHSYSLRTAQLHHELKQMHATGKATFAVALAQHHINDSVACADWLAEMVKRHEGGCLRHPMGLYKNGRSTLREAGLIAIKPFVDGEVIVKGFEPEFENSNPAFLNERGLTQRSHALDGMVAKDQLGALWVEWIKVPPGLEPLPFKVTGFSQAEKRQIWNDQQAYLGRIATIRYQAYGSKDRPRSPVFKCWRPAIDLPGVQATTPSA